MERRDSGAAKIASLCPGRRRTEVPGASAGGCLPELDPSIRTRLDEYQLELIGEVAVIAESALCAVFGRRGRMLRARARGIDPRPVLSPEQQSEFRVVHTFAGDTNDRAILYPMLRLMSERLGPGCGGGR